MTDKPKTIQEALAEVQRLANLQKGIRVAEMNAEITGEPIDEAGIIGNAFSAAKNIGKNFMGGMKGMNVSSRQYPAGAVGAAGEKIGGQRMKASGAERLANKTGKAVKAHGATAGALATVARSEEHTSEL